MHKYVLSCSLLAIVTSMAQADATSAEFQTLLVQRAENTDKNEAAKQFIRSAASEVDQIEQLRIHILRVPQHAAAKVRSALDRSGRFQFVETDGTAFAQALPSDPYLPSQWHLYKIDAPAAWLTTMGSSTAPIAILDSGVDPTHRDLASKLLPGYNFVARNTNTSDLTGHGTKVAGTAAAATDNTLGVAGVAARNPILPVVVLNASSYASYSNIAKGIIFAADRGVRVINISITGTTPSSTLQSAVDYAWQKGALVFAAAGNFGTSAPGYPAACEKVIAVGATDGTDAKASYSNFGAWIDVVAPGSGIYTTLRGGSYGTASGTSFASPIAAGVAALMLSVQPKLTPEQLSDLMKTSARDLGAVGQDPIFGWGRLDANAAVLKVLSQPVK